ncbi:endonuclease domain-containing protein [Streptomyces sp. NPDC059063]|uniref:endonuclease domain-containing protein n=1 Tax=Streptomyces sp. NPDC059063 TaxID=3346712 RepID=UPI0036CD3744
MAITEKRCSGCGRTKPIEEFSRRGYKANGEVKWTARCKPCRNAAEVARVHAAKAKGKGPDYSGLRNQREAEKLGLTLEQYLAITSAPCHICGKASGESGQRNSAYVNRRTAKAVGTICQKCASALGYLNHDPEWLKRALDLLDPERSS